MSWYPGRAARCAAPGRPLRAGIALGLALLALGCSSNGEEGGGVVRDTQDTFKSLYGFLVGSVSGDGGVFGRKPETQSFGDFTLKCPELEVRAGSSHYVFYAPNETPSPKTVRYQGTITQTARQCEFRPESVSFKFGFAGRVLLGPRGKEVSVEMPVRVLLAWRNDQVAWTKLYKVPVTIEPGQVSGFFVHVEENFDYKVPYGHQLSEYRLYIGFDGKGDQEGVPVAGALAGESSLQ